MNTHADGETKVAVDRARYQVNSVSGRELLYRIFLRFSLFMTCVVMVPMAALAFTFLVPPAYKGTAKVLIRYDKPDSAILGEVASLLSQDISGQSNAEILRSIPICQRVVKSLDLQHQDIARPSYKILASRAARVLFRLWPELDVAGDRQPDDSLQLAKELTESITAKVIQKSRAEVQVSDELIEVEVKSLNRIKVAQIVNQLCLAFIDEYYRLGQARAQQAYDYLGQQAAKASEALNIDDQGLVSNQKMLSDYSDRNINKNPLVDSTAKQVAELELKVAKLKSIYSENAPELIKAREDLKKVRGLLRRHESVESTKSLLSLLRDKRHQAYMTVQLYKNQLIPVTMVEEAVTPKYSKMLIISRYILSGGLGVIVGLILGFTVVMFFSAIDPCLYTPWEIEREGDLPVIGSFSVVASATGPRTINDLPLPAFTPAVLHTLGRLDLIGWQRGQTVLVTSALKGEGKTTVALQMAGALARDPSTRVLVIDGDFRQPDLTRFFHESDRPGLADALKGLFDVKAVIRSSEMGNLDVIPVGNIGNRLELCFFKKSLKKIFDEIRNEYDLILIDSGDIISSTEAVSFASETDRVLMVVRAGSTRRDPLLNALSMLNQLGRRPFGAILNFRRFPIPKVFYRLW